MPLNAPLDFRSIYDEEERKRKERMGKEPTAPDAGRDFTAGEYAKDIVAAPFRGVEAAVEDTWNLGNTVTFGLIPEYDLNGDAPGTRLLGESETTAGSLVEGATNFLTGFIPIVGALGKVGKIGKVAQRAEQALELAGDGTKVLGFLKKSHAIDLTRTGIASAITSATVFDGHEQRLSNLIQAAPALQNPITEFLAADREDPELVGRLKNAIEDAGLGVAADALVLGVKALWHVRKGKAAGLEGDALKEYVDAKVQPDALDAAVKKYFNPDDYEHFLPKEDVTWNGKPFESLDLSEKTEWAKSYGLDTYGPVSPEHGVRSIHGDNINIPGGFDGKFTYLDLMSLKANPFDPGTLAREDQVKLYKKLARTHEVDPGDDIEFFNRFAFGMQSANTPLPDNLFKASTTRVRSMEDIQKLANSIDWKVGDSVSKEHRQATNNALRDVFGHRRKADGGLGVSGTAQLTDLAEFAQLYLKDPKWFRRDVAKNEDWSDYVERLSTQLRGVAPKIASFAAVWQDPLKAMTSAIDRHMMRELYLSATDTIFENKSVYKEFRSKVIAKWNAKNPGKRVKVITDIDFASGEGIGELTDVLQTYMKANKSVFKKARGGHGKHASEALQQTQFVLEPKTVSAISDAYRKAVSVNQIKAELSGFDGVFNSQWNLWDTYRKRIEPHEAVFPGLHKLPALSRRQQALAIAHEKKAGWFRVSKKTFTDAEGITQKAFTTPRPSDLRSLVHHYNPVDDKPLAALGDLAEAEHIVSPGSKFNHSSIQEAIDAVKASDDGGHTFNPDGSAWSTAEPKDIVSLSSKNLTLDELTPDAIRAVLNDHPELMRNPDARPGIFRMEDPTGAGRKMVSVDMNVVVDPKHRANTLKFAKANDQQSIYSTAEGLVNAGGKGNTVLKDPSELARAADAITRGEDFVFPGGQPDVSLPRGYAAMAEHLEKAVQGAHPEDRGIVDVFARRVGLRMFDDVGLSMGGAASGSFDYASKVVEIGSKALADGELSWTMLHELWHNLARYAPKDAVDGVYKAFEKDRRRFIGENPEYGVRIRMKAFLDRKSYRYLDVDEWFAEVMTEKSMAKIKALADTKSGDRWVSLVAHAKIMFSEIVDALKAKFGFDKIDKLVNDFLNGRVDARVVRDYGFDAEIARRFNNPVDETHNILRDLGLDSQSATKVAAALEQRKATNAALGAPAGINPRLEDAETLADLGINVDELNMSTWVGSDDGIGMARVVEAYLRNVRERTPHMQPQTLGEQHARRVREVADMAGGVEPSNVNAAILAHSERTLDRLVGVSEAVQAQKMTLLATSEKTAKHIIEVTRKGNNSDRAVVEAMQMVQFLANLHSNVAGMLREQGRGLGANRLKVTELMPEGQVAGAVPNPVQTLTDVPASRGIELEQAITPESAPPAKVAADSPVSALVPPSANLSDPEVVKDIIQQNGGREKAVEFLDKWLRAYGEGGVAGTAKASKIAKATVGRRSLNILNEYFINAILSSPKTFVVNGLGGALTTLYRPAELAIGGALRWDKEVMADAFREFMYLADGISESLKFAKESTISGESLIDPGRQTLDLASKDRKAITAKNVGADPDSLTGRAIDWIGKAVRVPSHLLGGADEFLKQMNYRAVVKADLIRDGIKAGLSGEDLAKHVVDTMDKMTWKGQAYSKQSMLNRGLAEAEKAGVVGKEAKLAHARQFSVDNFDPKLGELSKRAVGVSEDVTFTNPLDPESKSGMFQRMVINHPELRLITPFIRTPINILKFTGQRFDAPAAMRLLASKKFPGYAKSLETSKNRLIMDALSNDPRRKAEAVGRFATGAGLAGFFFLKAREGVFTGRGPSDPEERAALEKTGWMQYSVKVGDGYVSYQRLDPFSTMLGTLADIADYARFAPEGDQGAVEALSMGVVTSLANNFTNKSYLTGLSNFVQAVSDPERFMPKLAQRYAGSMVPSIGNAFVTPTGDDSLRDVQSMLDAARNRTPGLSQDLMPVRDILGEPKKRVKSAGAESVPLLDSFLPVAYRSTSDDLINNELGRLGHGFTPPRSTSNGIDLRDFRKASGQTAYDRWGELTGTVKVNGQNLREELRRLIQSSGYRKLSVVSTHDIESPRIALLKRVIRRHQQRAFEQVLREFPDLKQRDYETATNRRLLKSGIDNRLIAEAL